MTNTHICILTASEPVLLCVRVDWLIDWWVDGRMTNWTCVCCGASEIYLPLHKMHGRHTIYPFTWITRDKRVPYLSLQAQVACLF